jgi:hypothetical protein
MFHSTQRVNQLPWAPLMITSAARTLRGGQLLSPGGDNQPDQSKRQNRIEIWLGDCANRSSLSGCAADNIGGKNESDVAVERAGILYKIIDRQSTGPAHIENQRTLIRMASTFAAAGGCAGNAILPCAERRIARCQILRKSGTEAGECYRCTRNIKRQRIVISGIHDLLLLNRVTVTITSVALTVDKST